MTDIRIVEMRPEDVGRIAEIDRSETVRFKYVYDDGELKRVEIDHEVPTWSKQMVAEAVEMLEPKLAEGSVLLGAFDAERLVGVAVLGASFIGEHRDQLQMAFLYVSNGYRRRGIARRLMDEICRLARERGARQLYISATESESAVGFYLDYGCRLAQQLDRALFELEPLDIHLTLDLGAEAATI